MAVKMEVYCRTRFVGFHRWENAPDVYRYLSYPHRHEFHVEVGVNVNCKNRQVEFQHLKRVVDDVIAEKGWDSRIATSGFSCEEMAAQLAAELQKKKYKVSYVDVSEDGENGGRVYFDV